jgi:hypothetical protein
MAKAIGIRDHVDDGLKDGENGCTTMVCIINRKAACRKEREGLPTATGGDVLATATGSHVTSPGRRATA